MSNFMKVYRNNHPVEEGWGTLLASMFMGPAGYATAVALSVMNIKQFSQNKDIRKYIDDECKKILKEEQRKDKSVTSDLPNDCITLLKRWWHNNDEVGFFSRTNWLHFKNTYVSDKFIDIKINNWTITYWGDTDHIDAAVVLLYSKEKDNIIGRRIPAPKSEKLSKLFHRE